jgi:hypothetical protein
MRERWSGPLVASFYVRNKADQGVLERCVWPGEWQWLGGSGTAG